MEDTITISVSEHLELGYLKANKGKFDIEFNRFKQDCRKRALDVAHQTISQAQGGTISKDIIKEADIYYKWLIDVK